MERNNLYSRLYFGSFSYVLSEIWWNRLCISIKLAGFLESLMIFLEEYILLQTGLLKEQSISKNDNKEMDISC